MLSRTTLCPSAHVLELLSTASGTGVDRTACGSSSENFLLSIPARRGPLPTARGHETHSTAGWRGPCTLSCATLPPRPQGTHSGCVDSGAPWLAGPRGQRGAWTSPAGHCLLVYRQLLQTHALRGNCAPSGRARVEAMRGALGPHCFCSVRSLVKPPGPESPGCRRLNCRSDFIGRYRSSS